jgi:hypothetical protein
MRTIEALLHHFFIRIYPLKDKKNDHELHYEKRGAE